MIPSGVAELNNGKYALILLVPVFQIHPFLYNSSGGDVVAACVLASGD